MRSAASITTALDKNLIFGNIPQKKNNYQAYHIFFFLLFEVNLFSKFAIASRARTDFPWGKKHKNVKEFIKLVCQTSEQKV